MTTFLRRGGATVTACLVLSAMSACSSQPTPAPVWTGSCPAQSGAALTLVAGSRANSPQLQLPQEVEALLHSAAVNGQQVQVIRVDGQPTVALSATFHTNGANPQLRQRDLDSFLTQTRNFVVALQPKQPEADLLTALFQAGEVTPNGGTIFVMDSGLATAGPLSFRNEDMFGARENEVTAYLAAQHLLPKLSDRAVLFAGLGQTADPQPALSGGALDGIGKLWHAIAKQAGATCVADVRTSVNRTSLSTSVPVTVVTPPAPPPPPTKCGTSVLKDNSPVGFIVDKADFREPENAESFLKGIADGIKSGPQLVTLTGTTSSEGSEADNQRLSEQRAAAVKRVLVRFGVPEGRITATGAGEKWPGRKPDMTPAGVLIPDAAAHNRSVVVDLKCP